MSAKEQFKSQFLLKPNEYSDIKKIIAVISGKGGVGKSLVTSLAAITMQKAGNKCAILDADITGPSIPQIFGLNEKIYGTDEGIIPQVTSTGIQVVSANLMLDDPRQAIIWRSPLITSIIKQFYTEVVWKDVDYMFVDLPPGTGDVPLTIFQSLPLDGVIIVTTPQDLVSLIVEKSLAMAEQMEIPVLGIVENMSYVVCDECGHRVSLFGDTSKIAEENDIEVIGRLPLDPKIARACDKGELEKLDVEGLEILKARIEQL